MSDWMLFVDGENFTLRGQELARQRELKLDAIPQYYLAEPTCVGLRSAGV